MIIRPKTHLLLPLLALSLTVALAGQVRAQNRDRHDDPSMSFQVNLGSHAHWTGVRGTHVRELRSDERPDYDMFKYGHGYYVHNNDHWYMSRRGRGEFRMIDDRQVPREFQRVPRDHWHNYPSQWSDQGDQRQGDRQQGDNHDHH